MTSTDGPPQLSFHTRRTMAPKRVHGRSSLTSSLTAVHPLLTVRALVADGVKEATERKRECVLFSDRLEPVDRIHDPSPADRNQPKTTIRINKVRKTRKPDRDHFQQVQGSSIVDFSNQRSTRSLRGDTMNGPRKGLLARCGADLRRAILS